MTRNITTIDRFEEKFSPEPMSGCWLWTAALLNFGYGGFRLHGKQTRASRTAWLLYRGEIPEGLNVLHRCDVRCCVNPDHLFLGTNADNVADKVAKGRQSHPRGDLCGTAKLTPSQVAAIREESAAQRKIAAKYGVGQATISRIRTGESWSGR